MRKIILAALAGVCLQTPAFAQEPPTPIGLKVVTGTWQTAADTDSYAVTLKRGRDYAIGAYVKSEGVPGQVTLRDPKGTRVGRVIEIGDEGMVGFEFRAAFNGTYTVTVTGGPGTYEVGLNVDCRAAKSTACHIRPGETKGYVMTSRNDVDWVRLDSLTPGRAYTLAYAGGGEARLATVNAAGEVKAQGNPIAFKGPSGALYARVTPADDFGDAYKLTLR